MKYLKMLGIAAISALGLMASVGAGTVSATTLSTDKAGTVKYTSGQTIHATLESGTSATLTNTSGNTIATCTGSTVHGFIGTATGGRVSGNISVEEGLTWEGCSQTTHTTASGSLEIENRGGDLGTVSGKGTKVTLGIFGVSCVYGTGEGAHLGTITGGKEATLKITATIPRVEGGFLCPSTGIWHASYIITTPHEVHIVS